MSVFAGTLRIDVQAWRSKSRRLLDGVLIGPLIKVLAKTGVTPNMLSVAGLGSSVAAAVVLSDGRFIIGGVIVLAGSSLDLLDGALARATNRVSKLGGFLDSSLDRLADAAVLMGLLAYFVNRGETQESLVAVAALVGAGTVSYVKARAEGLGLSCDVGLVTRPERIVLLGVGLLTDQVIVFLYAIAILSFITAGQRFLHAAKQLRSE